ncbi:MAG: 4-phosphoerythronate dehydrogenase [Pseudomonadota bacterium]
MKILMDENIPLAQSLFADLGQVTLMPGRDIESHHCQPVDILLVRSITKVNADLLRDSQVKFVGTCTIGTDHLDTDFLHRAGIHWASAPGCNANAVIQYVLSAMSQLEPDWLNKTVGIIGCGNIGSRLYQRLRALGLNCLCYDPFLSAADNLNLVDFKDVLQADIISCHTPLTQSGPFPTYHMFTELELAAIKPGAVLINSGRGEVIKTACLRECIDKNQLRVALDVWENEPAIDIELVKKVRLATPHIAGYSLEGKQRGSWMIYCALCEFLAIPIDQQKRDLLNHKQSALASTGAVKFTSLSELLLSCYDIVKDDARLRGLIETADDIAAGFDMLRKHYPVRREYSHFTTETSSIDRGLARQLALLQS